MAYVMIMIISSGGDEKVETATWEMIVINTELVFMLCLHLPTMYLL